MDEYKDYEDDLINYPERPLPSGRVLFKDLKALSVVVVALILLLNTYNSSIFLAACAVFGFSVLMLKWFFMEDKIRSSLPLALISHHPIVYLYLIYLFVAFDVSYPSTELASLYLIIPFSTGFTNWEISRKIRAPKDEDSYTTYSQILGLKQAVRLAVLFQLIVIAFMLYYFISISTPLWYIAVFVACYLPLLKFYLFFPTTGKTIKSASVKRPLRPIAESFQVLVIVAVVIEYLIF
jgi:4-hydroxybenzoate polyprenyltransferase